MVPRYLRLSVTGRCNLHCIYCRPEGPCAADLAREFTPEEILALVQCASAEGVRKVRLTGGEPLLRGDLEDIIAYIGTIPGIQQIALTTNGIGLAQRAARLRSAGLQSVNISLDTLRPERFLFITGRDLHREVLEGIEAATGIFEVVKLNTVLLRGVNEDEIEALVAFAARRGLWIRFIERYPSACIHSMDGCVPAEDVRDRLRKSFGMIEPLPASDLSVEETYVLPSVGQVKVGVIASVTGPPCERCSKLRFTAGGELRPCLFSDWGLDLAPLLRRGDLPAIRAVIRRVVARKQPSRCAAVVPGSISHIGG